MARIRFFYVLSGAAFRVILTELLSLIDQVLDSIRGRRVVSVSSVSLQNQGHLHSGISHLFFFLDMSAGVSNMQIASSQMQI